MLGFVVTNVLAEITHFADPGTVTSSNLKPEFANVKVGSDKFVQSS